MTTNRKKELLKKDAKQKQKVVYPLIPDISNFSKLMQQHFRVIESVGPKIPPVVIASEKWRKSFEQFSKVMNVNSKLSKSLQQHFRVIESVGPKIPPVVIASEKWRKSFEQFSKVMNVNSKLSKSLQQHFRVIESVGPKIPPVVIASEKWRKSFEQFSKVMNVNSKLSKSLQQHFRVIESVGPKIPPVVIASEKWRKSFEQFSKVMNVNSKLSKSLQQHFRVIESVGPKIPPVVIASEKWQTNILSIFKEVDRETSNKFFNEWGWLFYQKPWTFGYYWRKLYKKYGDNSFKDKLNGWFHKKANLNKVVNDIKLKFPERFHVLQEGCDYHIKRNYSCSITLLLPHIEGILWDLGLEKKYVKKGYNSKKKYSRFITDPNHKEWDLTELSRKLFPEDRFHNMIVKEIFCEGPRNKILHGRNIYNKKEKEISRWKSTLMILTLWRLSDEF